MSFNKALCISLLITIAFQSHHLFSSDNLITTVGQSEDNSQAIVDSMKSGNLEALKQYTFDANKLLQDRRPLIIAIEAGHENIVRYLVTEKRANVNSVNGDGLTPLMLAAGLGHLTMVKYFVEDYKALISTTDKNGLSALFYAAGQGKLDVVRYLVERLGKHFKPHIDGATALSFAFAKKHHDIVAYLIEKGVSPLPESDNTAELNSLFYDERANGAIKTEFFDVISYIKKPIAPSQKISGMEEGGMMHIYQPRVLEQKVVSEEFTKKQLQKASTKLGGTEELHLQTSPIFGGSCGYHAVKNAVLGLIFLNDYERLVECKDDEKRKKIAQWVSSDLESLTTLKTNEFDCENFMEQLHAKIFMIQQQNIYSRPEAVSIQQGTDHQRDHIFKHLLNNKLADVMRRRHQTFDQGLALSMVNSYTFDCLQPTMINGWAYRNDAAKNFDSAETLYQKLKFNEVLSHLNAFDLWKQIALFRSKEKYRHAFILSLNIASKDGYLNSEAMHGVSVIIDKRSSLVNVIVAESNNMPTFAIKDILFDFLDLFINDQKCVKSDEKISSLAQCGSSPFDYWITSPKRDLPSFESLAKAYKTVREKCSTDKKRQDIHYAFFLLSEIEYVYKTVQQQALKEESQAIDKIFQSLGLLWQNETDLRNSEIALHNLMQEIEENELNERMLHFIQTDDIESLRQSLIIGANPNVITGLGMTALGMACLRSKNPYEVCRSLVEGGASVKLCDKTGTTPLMIASQRGNLELVRYLVEKGAEIDSINNSGSTALMFAACGWQDAHLEIIKFLINNCKADCSLVNHNGFSALTFSVCLGKIDIVTYFIYERKMSVDFPKIIGCMANRETVMPDSSKVGRNSIPLDVIDYFIKELSFNTMRHPDLVAKLLMAVAKFDDINGLKRLLEPDCAMNSWLKAGNGMKALFHAIKHNSSSVVKYLVETNEDENDHEDNKAAFEQAIKEGEPRILNCFLGKPNFTIDSSDQDGFTTLMYAASRTDLSLVEFMVERYKPNLNTRNGSGLTALMLAAGRHQTTIECKANECSFKKPDESLLFRLLKRSHLDLVRYLVHEGCDINATDNNGNTVLMHAISADRLQVVQFLLQNENIDLNLINNEGKTAIDLAHELGNPSIMRLFESSLK